MSIHTVKSFYATTGIGEQVNVIVEQTGSAFKWTAYDGQGEWRSTWHRFGSVDAAVRSARRCCKTDCNGVRPRLKMVVQDVPASDSRNWESLPVHLLEAAPELLGTLRKILAIAERVENCHSEDVIAQIEAARVVVAKAEGRKA